MHRGGDELRNAIALHEKNISADDVLVCPSAATALFIISTTLLNSNDHLIVLRPNYATNIETPRAINCEISLIDLTYENSFQLDIDEIKNNIKPNTKYPAVYFQAGMNDPRVPLWMSGKMAATLQASSTSGKPVLLDTNFEGGHNGDANAATSIDKWRSALKMVFFLLWQSGHKDFQQK